MRAGIVGGGIAGKLLAFRLLQLGWQISLFEQSPHNCSMSAAGLLTPVAELANSPAIIYALGVCSFRQLWPSILGQLPDKVLFNSQGSLIVAHPNDAAELHNFIRLISAKLPAENLYQTVDKQGLKHLEPDLHKFEQAYFLPQEGNIDNQALMNALTNYLTVQNINWQRNHHVKQVKPYQIMSQQGVYDFDYVFDCRGMGGKEHFRELRGVRGELIRVHAPEVNISRPLRLFHPRHRFYLVPRSESIYLLGASEIESEDGSPISLRSALELLSAAFYVHSGFAEARILDTVTDCRPTLANHLPRINYQPGLIAINGLYRHGFLIAPALIEDVVGFLQGQGVKFAELWEDRVGCVIGK